jgi:hypothetical protein
LNAVNGPHSKVGDNAYQARAPSDKIQRTFVSLCPIPARGQQVRQRRQNASIVVDQSDGPNRRRGHFVPRVIESNKRMSVGVRHRTWL